MPEENQVNFTEFEPIEEKDLNEILGLTVKHDEINRLTTFYSMLSAYTENNQLNISFRAPSSTGKSYIPLELSQLFPKEDLIQVGYSSPKAFFHDFGEWVPDFKGYRINLEKKIIIFLDQPHDMLLKYLRPMLSHDKKEILNKITDKTEKHGTRTKNILIRGFPAVTFCTGSLRVDEQEATRMILLSPETTQEKIREGIILKILKESNPKNYKLWLENDEERILLKRRIMTIKKTEFNDIIIPDPDIIKKEFLEKAKKLKPRHQRDVGKIISLAKASCLLNCWFREKDLDENLLVSNKDIKTAFKLWDNIGEAQELGISPYLLRFYEEIILPIYLKINDGKDPDRIFQRIKGEKGRCAECGNDDVYLNWKDNDGSYLCDSCKIDEEVRGLTRKEIMICHYEVYGRPIQDWFLRREILTSLESCGLIAQEQDPNNKRLTVVHALKLKWNKQSRLGRWGKSDNI